MADLTHELIEEATAGYIEAIYFTDTGEHDQCPKTASFRSREVALHHVRTFCVANADLVLAAVDQLGYSATRLGHDLWLSRNGHGAGFFDREELGVDNPRDASDVGDLANALQDAAEKAGEKWTDFEVFAQSDNEDAANLYLMP